jgi:tRNA pseudouridine38-40 synthase
MEQPCRRIKLTVSYDGTDYHGWQVQPGLRTIQGELEAVLGEIEKAPVPVAGSGRTDAGVHALAQVAAVTLRNPIPTDNLRRAMNRLLPAAIRILSCEEAAPEFHPRFDAVLKIYEYRIYRREVCPPFDRRYVHHHPYPLDEDRMAEMAVLFEGEHDFRAFAAADAKDALGATKKRHISLSRLERAGDRLIYRVGGSGFLKHMVRLMVGTLIEGGKGNLGTVEIRDLLSGVSEVRAGPAVPACGLFLVTVLYE